MEGYWERGGGVHAQVIRQPGHVRAPSTRGGTAPPVEALFPLGKPELNQLAQALNAVHVPPPPSPHSHLPLPELPQLTQALNAVNTDLAGGI